MDRTLTTGLGLAGNPRCLRAWLPLWAAAGIEARGFDSRPPASFGTLAAAMTDDPAAFAQGLRVLFVCTDDILQCEALLLDGPGFVRSAPRLEVIVLAATLPPRFVKALRARIPARIALVDAPWSGNSRALQRGTLTMLLGGPEEVLAALAPVLAPLSAATERMGGFGSASAAGVMRDFLAASSTAMTRLALDWARAQGIEERRLLDVLGTSGAAAGAVVARGPVGAVGAAPGEPPGTAIMAAFLHEIETAFDAALAGSSLTPPQPLPQPAAGSRGRALH